MNNNTLHNILLFGIVVPGWGYMHLTEWLIEKPEAEVVAMAFILGAQLIALFTVVALKKDN